ncbi:MAG TPA: hypothetical protein VHL56_03910, partial [Candidatus Limnocylindrales bacterium]|nr:hypothetical protein [Candidatus Limnocylindrales bacterium]
DRATIAAGHGTWWRLADVLDGNGALVGRTLYAGRAAKTTLTMALGTESMARGPVGGLLVVTNDDGRDGEIRVVDISKGCSWVVHRDANVVRSAILDPASGTAYAHLVQRETRVDLGVFQLSGGDPEAALEQVLQPLPTQADLGRIWATELRLNADGSALAAQSCSDKGCLTRVVAVTAFGRPVSMVKGKANDAVDGQGSIIGFAGDRLITWSFCAGMPCAVQSWAGGAQKPTKLADRAIGAGLTRDGRFLVVLDDLTGRAVRLDLAGNTIATIAGVNPGELPLSPSVTATSGLDVADDQVGFASQGGDPHSLAPGSAAVIP